MTLRQFLILLLLPLLASTAYAQTNARIKQLEKQRADLLAAMQESEKLLDKAGKDIGSQLKNLALLDAQIRERTNYINRLQSDIRAVDDETRKLTAEIKTLGDQLQRAKDDYARSLRQMRSNRTVQDKLMFIFSASTLQQTYRRMRYLQEYSSFRKAQGIEINRKREALRLKEKEMREVLDEKKKLLAEVEKEQENLVLQQERQRKLLTQLRSRQSAIRKEVAAQRRKSEQLDRKIDELIKAEIERARREAEARAKAEAAKGGNTDDTTPSKTMGAFKLNERDRKLSGDFERNKGILPVPVTSAYAIINHYGRYNVAGLRGVQLDNKGVDIQAQPGAMARAIFKGEVSAVFEYSGLKGVLVRHGNYISVYCNLSSVLVRQGDEVATRQAIGKIYSNPNDGDRTVLHFQLRKETAKLNPEEWIDD